MEAVVFNFERWINQRMIYTEKQLVINGTVNTNFIRMLIDMENLGGIIKIIKNDCSGENI